MGSGQEKRKFDGGGKSLIYKDRLVQVDRSFGIRSSEILYDFFFLLCLGIAVSGSVISYPDLFLVPFLLLMAGSSLYLFLLVHFLGYAYFPSVYMDAFLGFLFLPFSWFHPVLFGISLILSYVVVFTIRSYGKISFPFCLVFLSFCAILFYNFPDLVISASVGQPEWIPNWKALDPLLGGESSIWLSLSWLGFFTYSLAFFRRFSVFAIGLGFLLWIYTMLDGQESALRFFHSLSYAGFFFAVYLLPSRNHYFRFWGSFLALVVLILAGIFLDLLGFDKQFFLFLGFLLFFTMEAALFHFFYERKKIQGRK